MKSWLCIGVEGRELYDYLQTKKGKEKRFFVYQDDDGDTIGIEEVENTTKGETKGERKTRYHNQVKSEINAEEVSLDDTVIGDNGDEMPLAETVADEEMNIEDEVVPRSLLEAPLRVVMMRYEGKKVREIAEALDLNQQSISRICARYRKEGVEEFARNKYTSHHRYLSKEEESEILERFLKEANAGKVVIPFSFYGAIYMGFARKM